MAKGWCQQKMKDDSGQAPVYPMGVAERLTGLTGRQIRYYEKNGLLTPARTQGRHRLYTDQDIRRLKEIKRLMEDGISLANVKEMFAERAARLAAAKRNGLLTESEEDRRGRLGREGRLTSLYPLSNRAELLRIIDRDE